MKWVWRAVIAMVLLIPAVGAGLFFWLRTGVPSYDGTIAADALTAPVQIMRDGNAVPHIFASNEHDAYFALGYVHAQDRLWQMDIQRRIGAGRLSEIVGERGLGSDRYMRTLGLYRHAEAAFDHLSRDVQLALLAYAEGVNTWIANRRRSLPPEYLVLRTRPDRWSPADSIVWGKIMAVQLSGNYRGELLRTRIADALGPDVLDDLFPHRLIEQDPITMPDDGELASQLPDDHPRHATAGDQTTPRLRPARQDGLPPHLTELAEAALPAPFPEPFSASNAWVVSGELTNTGSPILANDPHLGLQSPILWYLARLETPDWSITGATVPGVPFHLIGHNGSAAWGFTTTNSDTQDVFRERLDPEDSERYLTPDGTAPFEVRQETIPVKGGDSVTLRIRSTRHGPVISDIGTETAAAAAEGEVLALAFPALTDQDTSAEALYRLNRARNWSDFTGAMSQWVAPQQNVVYADTHGTTGLYVPGLLPVRSDTDGRLPAEGWHGEDDWQGYVPFEDLPHVRDPERGWLVNANNRVVRDDYAFDLGHDYDAPYRARRIEDLLSGTIGEHDVEDSVAIQMDTVSLAAEALLDVLLDLSGERSRHAEALSLLRSWSFEMDRERPEPLIFNHWLREINRALFSDSLGPAFSDYWAQRAMTVQRLLSSRPRWCDPDAPAETDDRDLALTHCAPLALEALDRALERLTAAHGENMEQWRWGDEHVAPLDNQVMAFLPIVRSIIDLSVETDGGFYTINRGGYRVSRTDQPFGHVHGAGLRAVFDLHDLDNSRFIIATGQSGNPLSDNYGNMVLRWREGDTITIHGDPADIAESGLGTLTLRRGALDDD
ncbi:penicillin acylase family protein [Fodinicurvata sp. EGI_FJ10296]|uniref:penicillin acylase family protein n=1 Tax=Fodinicurvata sp. EGI_FJ10296 TaxID=3231908 RepID=UPI0034550868